MEARFTAEGRYRWEVSEATLADRIGLTTDVQTLPWRVCVYEVSILTLQLLLHTSIQIFHFLLSTLSFFIHLFHFFISFTLPNYFAVYVFFDLLLSRMTSRSDGDSSVFTDSIDVC